MKIDLKKLVKFLVNAKRQAYAGEGSEVKPQRPGFKELEYSEGNYSYRDSYTGFFSAPGQEIVRFYGKPIWSMAYSGGMNAKFQNDVEFAEKTFSFLKKALMKVTENIPFRGPKNFKEGDFEYVNEVEGNISNFKGHEMILFKGKDVFSQDYIGGLIVHKSDENVTKNYKTNILSGLSFIGILLVLAGLYLISPGIVQAVLAISGAIILFTGLYFLMKGKHLIANQSLLLIGSILLLAGQSVENISKLFNYLTATDLLTIGSFAFIIGIFLYGKSKTQKTVGFYLALSAISALFLFVAGFALIVPYIFASAQTNFVSSYAQKLPYLTTAFVFVGLLDLIFSAVGFAILVQSRLNQVT